MEVDNTILMSMENLNVPCNSSSNVTPHLLKRKLISQQKVSQKRLKKLKALREKNRRLNKKVKMFVQIVALLLALLLSLLYLRWRRVKGYWARLGVVHSPPNPICGSLTFLLRRNVGIYMRETYEKFVTKDRVKYVGIWYFWRPVLMVTDPDIARNVLVKDFANFRNRQISSGPNDPIGTLNVFTLNDPVWTQVRKRLTPVFTSSKLKQLQSFIQKKSKEIVQRIALEKDNKIDLRQLLSDYTTDVIGTSAFGIASDATLTGDSSMRTITREFMKFSVYRGCCWTSIFFWPELVEIFGFTFFPKDSVEFFRKIYKTIVSQRQTAKVPSQNRDLLDALIQIKKKGEEDGEEFSDDLLIAQGIIFLQAGFDTSSGAMTFMFNELAHAPEIQEKMYAELVEAKEKNGSENLDSDVLEGLTYFNCVIKETLRKYPAMGWLDRITANDYVVDENLTIKAGTPIAVNSMGMHYDPEYFPDPYKFDPDRFLPENEGNIKPYTYMPFGEGPRNCIGMRFAQMSVRLAVSAMMLTYRMEPYPNTPLPDKCEIEKRGMFYLPGEPVHLHFIPRK